MRSHGRLISERGLSGFAPAITNSPARGSVESISRAGAPSSTFFAPVLESGRFSKPFSKSISFQRRFRISPARQPVSIINRMAATANGEMISRRFSSFAGRCLGFLSSLKRQGRPTVSASRSASPSFCSSTRERKRSPFPSAKTFTPRRGFVAI